MSKLNFAMDIDLTNSSLREEDLCHRFKAGEIGRKAHSIALKFKFQNFSSSVKRQFTFLTETIALNDTEKRKESTKISRELEVLYGKAKACPKKLPCLHEGEHQVVEFMRKERDYDKLADVWEAWQTATGPVIKPLHVKMVQLANEGARLHGYKDAGYAEWFLDFRYPEFVSDVLKLFQEVLPLYQQIHAFVRHRLLQVYPGKFKPRGPIPAHLLGNPWAQQWDNIMKLVTPFPEEKGVDIGKALKKLSPKEMMQMAEEFFTSVDLFPMTKTFWNKSVLSEIPGKIVQCHASAYDLGNAEDYRIKMCSRQDYETFITMHHEMGHIEYYMAYSHLPKLFRTGANSAFHEAIGDTIALSVSTPDHLFKKKLLEALPSNEKFDLNVLFHKALTKVVFLPFGLVCDLWRWQVFNGTMSPEQYNEGWWKLRLQFQGIAPPSQRPKEAADALSKYHLAVDISYIRYFISNILQFQFYEAMCNETSHTGPLHRCDFYGAKNAGGKFKRMLSLGASRPWEDALELATGHRKVKTDSILRYFKPLHDWLKKENARLNNTIGWDV